MKIRPAAWAALAALLIAPAAGFAQGTTPQGTAPQGTTTQGNPPAAASPAPPASGTSQPAPAARRPAPARPAATTPATRPAALPAGQFKTEAEAKAHCPSDRVVWANKESRIYHLQGERYYGKTRSGAYMCQKEAGPAGFRAPRGHAQPTARTTAPAAPPSR